jgi:hypothetical protein
VCTAHFGAGLIGCEHPFDGGADGVSLSFPCGDFVDEALWIVDSAVQALAAEYTDLDLDHIEHAVVFWGVVELQASQNSLGFGGRECLIESAGRVGRQVVLHNPDVLGIGIMDIGEFARALGVVFCRPPLGDLDLAPSRRTPNSTSAVPAGSRARCCPSRASARTTAPSSAGQLNSPTSNRVRSSRGARPSPACTSSNSLSLTIGWPPRSPRPHLPTAWPQR